jgi:two-component system KDP operon response regulator KdpE
MTSSENKTPLSILVIDDEAQIQRLLTVALESNGYRVTTAGDGKMGIAAAAQRRHDAIILDLGLPDMNGIEVLKKLREWTQTPVIVLTVQDGETEKVESLDGGADDYVTKPFNTAELLARVRATVRRANRGQTEEPVHRFGDVEVDLSTRRVTRNGQPLKMTATEYVLLRLFVQHAGKVLTHRQILREVWGAEHETQTQYLRVYMARLREKLEMDPTEPVLFSTEPGVGYWLVETISTPS